MSTQKISATKGAQQQVKKSPLVIAALAAVPATLWTPGLIHAEGLTAQFTLGQQLVYTNEEGVVNDPDEGFVSRTSLGLVIGSQTRNQNLTFSVNTGLDYNLTNDIERSSLHDPVLQLSYTLENRNNVLSFDASYQRTDIDDTAFTDDPLVSDNDISIGGGVRETFGQRSGLIIGRESPLMFELNQSYSRTEFSGTVDTSLVDTTTRGLDGRLTFRLSPVASVYAFASFNDRDAETAGASDRRTERLGVGALYTISPVLTATAELSYDQVDTDDNAGTVTSDDGLGFRFGLERTLANGALTFDLREEETVNGRRRQVSVGRDYAFKRGTLAFSVGASQTDGLSVEPLFNLTANYELDKNAALRVTLSQRASVDSDNDSTINTSLGIDYTRELTSLSSLSAGLQLRDRQVEQDNSEDQNSLQLNLTHRYQVGGDWDLVSGLTYARTQSDATTDRNTSTVFVGLERTFDWRP